MHPRLCLFSPFNSLCSMSHSFEPAVLSAKVPSLLVKPLSSLSFPPPPLFPISLCFPSLHLPSLYFPVHLGTCLPVGRHLCTLLATHPNPRHYLAYGRSSLEEMSECITIIDNSWPYVHSLLLGDYLYSPSSPAFGKVSH